MRQYYEKEVYFTLETTWFTDSKLIEVEECRLRMFWQSIFLNGIYEKVL